MRNGEQWRWKERHRRVKVKKRSVERITSREDRVSDSCMYP